MKKKKTESHLELAAENLLAASKLFSRAVWRRSRACLMCGVVLAAAIFAAAPVFAGASNELVFLINEFRQSAQTCQGRQFRPVGPLAPDPALARVQIASGTQLQRALKEAGYQAAQAQAIAVSGPANAKSAMNAIKERYCGMLLNPQYTAIGVSRNANTWHVVLAQPLLSSELGDWRKAGKEILALTNAARAEARSCGKQKFGAAPPVEWNPKLGASALVHSRDMAKRNYFSHKGKDGSHASSRAKRAGYNWRRIGENIATGQGSPKQVMSGWLASPEHCANIMNRNFTEMGAAYALNSRSDTTIYWTQVFGTPR